MQPPYLGLAGRPWCCACTSSVIPHYQAQALEEGGRHLQSCKNDAAPIMYWRTEAPRHFCNSCTASDTRFVVLFSSLHRPASWIPFVDMLFPSYPMFLCPSDSLVFLFPPPLSLSYTLSLSLSVLRLQMRLQSRRRCPNSETPLRLIGSTIR